VRRFYDPTYCELCDGRCVWGIPINYFPVTFVLVTAVLGVLGAGAAVLLGGGS
jgi:hypothetical protein